MHVLAARFDSRQSGEATTDWNNWTHQQHSQMLWCVWFTRNAQVQPKNEKFLVNSHSKRKLKFGWSAKFVNAAKGFINNGVIFPACNKCRQAGLKKLGLQFKKVRKKNDEAMENEVEEEAKVEEEVCKECSNWDLLNKDVDLSSLQHKVLDSGMQRLEGNERKERLL